MIFIRNTTNITSLITSEYTGNSSSKAVTSSVRVVVAVEVAMVVVEVAVMAVEVAMVVVEVAIVAVEVTVMMVNNRMSVDRVNPRASRLDITGRVLMNRVSLWASKIDNRTGWVRSVCIPSVNQTPRP